MSQLLQRIYEDALKYYLCSHITAYCINSVHFVWVNVFTAICGQKAFRPFVACSEQTENSMEPRTWHNMSYILFQHITSLYSILLDYGLKSIQKLPMDFKKEWKNRLKTHLELAILTWEDAQNHKQIERNYMYNITIECWSDWHKQLERNDAADSYQRNSQECHLNRMAFAADSHLRNKQDEFRKGTS